MSGDDLTPSESAILVVLMAEARELSNTELKERYGIDFRKANRDKLNRIGYVESRPSGRTYVHQLADRGWVRVQSDLNFDSPRARALGGALTALHTHLRDRILPRHDYHSFGEMFATTDLRTPAPQPEQHSQPEQQSQREQQSQSEQSEQQDVLLVRIRQAYAALAGGPGEWVSLTRLRPFFGDVDAADLDAALRQLERGADVDIVPESNQKMLTPADVAAALRLGGQDKHLLAIGV